MASGTSGSSDPDLFLIGSRPGEFGGRVNGSLLCPLKLFQSSFCDVVGHIVLQGMAAGECCCHVGFLGLKKC